MDDASQEDATAAHGGPGSSGDAREAGDLIEQIGAEIDRRLDARLTALGLTVRTTYAAAPALPADQTPAGTPRSLRRADAVPGASPRPVHRAGVNRSPWQSLWIGIMIGSAVIGAAAIAQGVRISTDVNQQVGGPDTFVNASWVIVEALAGAWVLLFVIYCVQFVAGHARDRAR